MSDVDTAAAAHIFRSSQGAHLFVADRSRIYDLDAALERELQGAFDAGAAAVEVLLQGWGLLGTPRIGDAPLQDPPMRSISLAVAQKCNLGCGYCYAQGGSFGTEAKNMPWEVSRDAVLRLLQEASAGQRVHISFLGGEPLINRALVRRTTEFAVAQAAARQVGVGFAITTNGTLLQPDDGAFFEEHGFAVTASVDGVGATHDRLRPFAGGGGSYQRVMRRLEPLLAMQRRMQVSARVTVTPANLDLPATLDALVALGFHSVGFAPLLNSPSAALELDAAGLDRLLEEMKACGRRFETETIAGRRYPFSNMTEALKQIHRGTHRPYPCGAGAGYFGVSADGGLYACHRFVEDPAGKLGDVVSGIDRPRRNLWLAQRHVHQQSPCTTCWARYLCGGGCHHEVMRRGRSACDFIRGWLRYCLGAYVELMEARPGLFDPPRPSA